MKFLSAAVEEFGSYEKLIFDFENQGLTLIEGATGSGKSTICDIIPWVLFGKTAKNGLADDICRWGSKNTKVTLNLMSKGKLLRVTRTRNPNDLVFWYEGEDAKRGKDLPDTQRLLNEELGCTPDLYLSAAYYNETSPASSFFSTTSKFRRQIAEQITDLSYIKEIEENLSDLSKGSNAALLTLQQDLETLRNSYKQVNAELSSFTELRNSWDASRQQKLNRLEKLNESFKLDKSTKLEELYYKQFKAKSDLEQEIKEFSSKISSAKDFDFEIAELEIKIEEMKKEVCGECGSPKASNQVLVMTKYLNKFQTAKKLHERDQITLIQLEQSLARLTDPSGVYLKQIAEETARKNTYTAEISSLESDVNPYSNLLDKKAAESTELKHDIQATQEVLNEHSQSVSDSELLQDVLATTRGELVKSTLMELESRTNELLTTHFDAEIKVLFTVEDQDNIDYSIEKYGNICSYVQLSKGQKQLLKLCFAASVMQRISDYHYLGLSCVFLDESLDGLDEVFKLRAYGLLEELAAKYDSVFVVEHNETFKSMFTNKIHVEMTSNGSTIEKN